jgi:hypothetical protein
MLDLQTETQTSSSRRKADWDTAEKQVGNIAKKPTEITAENWKER